MSSQRSDGQYISYEDEDMDTYSSLWLVEPSVGPYRSPVHGSSTLVA